MQIIHKQTTIFYTKQGTGEALVLLHGFMESHHMWNTFIKKWSKSHTVIAIDLPGHGQSGCLGYIHTMEQLAESVIAVLKHEKISSATFIGHSLGGYVALALLDQHPNFISKLMLLNSTPEADSDERKTNRDRAVQLLKAHPKAYISMAISNLFAQENLKIFCDEIEQLKKEALAFPIQGLIATTEGMKVRKDRSNLLKTSQIQKAIVAAKEDPIISLEYIKKLASDANAALYELEGGHMSTIENKKGVENAIGHFLGLD